MAHWQAGTSLEGRRGQALAHRVFDWLRVIVASSTSNLALTHTPFGKGLSVKDKSLWTCAACLSANGGHKDQPKFCPSSVQLWRASEAFADFCSIHYLRMALY